MSVHSQTHRMTHLDLLKMREAGEKIAMLTCYDASFAHLCENAGVDALLVGDSLGMVLQGHDTTLPVTINDIAYHTGAVARGSQRALIIAEDLGVGNTFHATNVGVFFNEGAEGTEVDDGAGPIEDDGLEGVGVLIVHGSDPVGYGENQMSNTSISCSTSAIALTAVCMPVASTWPMQPTRNVSTWVNLPG